MKTRSISIITFLFIFSFAYSLIVKLIFMSGLFPKESINSIFLVVGKGKSLFLVFSAYFAFAFLILLLHQFLKIHVSLKKISIPLLILFFLESVKAWLSIYYKYFNISMETLGSSLLAMVWAIILCEICIFIIIITMPTSNFKKYLTKFAWLYFITGFVYTFHNTFYNILFSKAYVNFKITNSAEFLILNLLLAIPWLVILHMMLRHDSHPIYFKS